MEECPGACRHVYFPAAICAEYDSPIDALIGLHVPQDEALDLVAAAWADGGARCVLARVDGGRQVAAILLPGGRWAACNVFAGQFCATPREAGRRLEKLLKRGRRGTVGALPAGRANENAGS
ncbi:hypothetical protein [Propionivibrio sp.]|uniref:hypothetical protein n=1 Tax=Propionivibrio sp. TaxID=2212460 RepID=UPI0039E269B2